MIARGKGRQQPRQENVGGGGLRPQSHPLGGSVVSDQHMQPGSMGVMVG